MEEFIIDSIETQLDKLVESFIQQCKTATKKICELVSQDFNKANVKFFYPDKEYQGFVRTTIWSAGEYPSKRNVVNIQYRIDGKIEIRYHFFETEFQRATDTFGADITLSPVNLLAQVENIKKFLLTGEVVLQPRLLL